MAAGVLFQSDNCGSPSAGLGWGVTVVQDEIGAGENRADNLTLYTDATAVDDTQCLETEAPGFQQVFFDDRLYVAGWDTVEIEDVRDRNAERSIGIGVHRK
jgi:hypothetical protein